MTNEAKIKYFEKILRFHRKNEEDKINLMIYLLFYYINLCEYTMNEIKFTICNISNHIKFQNNENHLLQMQLKYCDICNIFNMRLFIKK